MKLKTKSHYETLQQYAEEYCDETGRTTFTALEIATWAIRTQRWDAPPDLLLKACRSEFARAFREEHLEDRNGMPVRAKHVARITRGDRQLHIWADIRKAPHEHMELAFQQRREQIVGDCRQLKRDVDFYTEQRPENPRIQMVFDFSDDIEEAEAPAEYPRRRPEE